MTAKHTTLVAIAVVTVFTAVVTAQSSSRNYTQWRGSRRDGAAAAFNEPKAWPERLTERWKVDVGLGYATPLVVGDRIYMFSRKGENETMSALDAASGKVLWQTGYPVRFEMNKAAARHGPGPKATPVFANGRLYSIGMTGIVTAFDAGSGKQLWQKPGSEPLPMYTTHSFSPAFDRGVVFFHVGGHGKGALTAFDASTGEVKWSWDGDGPGYGSPIVVDLAGTRQVIALTQAKLVGLDAATGALLWARPFVSTNFTNSATPVLYRQTVIASNGGPVVAVNVTKRNNAWAVENAWENPDQPFRLSNAVVVGDTVFGLSQRNQGQYFAIDARTGKTLWTSEPRQAANASIVYSGRVVFSLEEDGELVVFRNSGTGLEQLRRYKLADAETWTQPVISGNRVFVKDVSSLALWTLN
jgi:outer membrane protein assembly factor BamB